SAGDKVGYAVTGTGSGSPMVDPQQFRLTPRGYGQTRRFWIDVVVWVSSPRERQAGATLRVADGNGVALQGATAYLNRLGGILGQTDANGMMSIVLPPNLNEGEDPRLVAVHVPGKVPVFLKAEEVPIGRVTEVALHADELVVKFYLL